MLNQVILLGRIVEIEKLKTENGNSKTTITLSISRSYKNSYGEYDYDVIKCVLWRGIAESKVEYCKKEDLVGVTGRLQSNDNEMVVVAEKITFI